MITSAENSRLSGVNADTPGGALLRRYWHPIAPSAALESERILPVRILGEDLVVCRGDDGAYWAIAERCPHRGASLSYGWVEPTGVRCPYHGWVFDRAGNCVEMPFESREQRIRTSAYPVEVRSGLLFVYMGPETTCPPVPQWDILGRTDGRYRIELQPDLRCNWLQIQENAADVTHTFYVHSYRLSEKGIADESGFDLPMKQFGFQPFDWGLVKSWTYADPTTGDALSGWGNLLVFPNILRLETEMHWRVPVDDTHTRIFILAFTPMSESRVATKVDVVQQPPRVDETERYTLDTFFSQDAMVWETQGRLCDRTSEHLVSSDVGIVMFRRMLLDQMEALERGSEPTIGRPNDNNVIDLRAWMGGYLPMSAPRDSTVTFRRAAAEIFDARHRTFDVLDVAAVSTRPARRQGGA